MGPQILFSNSFFFHTRTTGPNIFGSDMNFLLGFDFGRVGRDVRDVGNNSEVKKGQFLNTRVVSIPLMVHGVVPFKHWKDVSVDRDEENLESTLLDY